MSEYLVATYETVASISGFFSADLDGRSVPADVERLDLRALVPPYVIIEDRLDPKAPARLYRDPTDVVQCDRLSDVEACLSRIDAATKRGLYAAGFMSFEMGYAFEARLSAGRVGASLPLLWFGLFEAPQQIGAADLDAAFAAAGPPKPLLDLEMTLGREDYRKAIRIVLEHIVAGDVYQVNFTFPIEFRHAGDPLSLYAALRTRQAVAHGGVVALGGATILSVSPELFVEVRDGQATTRPMKGTAARGTTPLSDVQAAQALASDIKQRAENLMIVDLLRNDLARISTPGSVAVPELFKVETYSTLHTMTSTITSSLRPDVDFAMAMRALFPCGSVVGAPKLRATELIQALERTPRGVYTGAIGDCSPRGDFAFNVAIRTAVIDRDGRGRYGVGGGIVADSDPDAEYDECLLKARVLTDLAVVDYGLIETLLWSHLYGFQWPRRHLDRLAKSARALGFTFDPVAAEAQLSVLARDLESSAGSQRVRLELRRTGALDVTVSPLTPEPERPLLVGIATGLIDGADPFLRHKTTLRGRYDASLAQATAHGLDEVVFVNRYGFVTEAACNNVFVEKGACLVTPPVAAGLLPGILRQTLLDSGEAIEGSVTLDDLRYRSWFLGSSIRGLRSASLA